MGQVLAAFRSCSLYRQPTHDSQRPPADSSFTGPLRRESRTRCSGAAVVLASQQPTSADREQATCSQLTTADADESRTELGAAPPVLIPRRSAPGGPTSRAFAARGGHVRTRRAFAHAAGIYARGGHVRTRRACAHATGIYARGRHVRTRRACAHAAGMCARRAWHAAQPGLRVLHPAAFAPRRRALAAAARPASTGR
jgi:hypothetical protein